jgi:hypothetical protein
MARDAGMAGMLSDVITTLDELERFADLVAAHEREQCAKVCERLGAATNGTYERLLECAAAIRARGEALK